MLKADVHDTYPDVFLGNLKPMIEASLKTVGYSALDMEVGLILIIRSLRVCERPS